MWPSFFQHIQTTKYGLQKMLIGLITVLVFSFIYTNAECQTTPEEYRRIRIARGAEEVRKRELQQSQEKERQRKMQLPLTRICQLQQLQRKRKSRMH